MQYRTLGKTGCKVSALGFGCMRLPLLDQNVEHIDVKLTDTLLRSAMDKGINYIDTAYGYHHGLSEIVLGTLLGATGLRKNIYLASKLPPWTINTRQDMHERFEEQCQRLQTDYLDFYLVHNLNKSYWPKLRDLGVLDFLEQLKKEGRIRHIGFSFHDDLPIFEEILDAYDWEFTQIQYNYLDEELQAGTAGLKKAVAKGCGVVIMEPLRGGNLAQTPPEDIQAVWKNTGLQRSPAEWGLRWLLDKPEISLILSGMNTQKQLDENSRVCAEHLPGTLSTAEMEAISTVRDLFLSKFKVPCTACRYCMPCPAGVNIPGIFNTYNQYGLFGNKHWCANMYNYTMVATKERADNCVACGQCEEACPQHIKIIEVLKEAHAVLELCTRP